MSLSVHYTETLQRQADSVAQQLRARLHTASLEAKWQPLQCADEPVRGRDRFLCIDDFSCIPFLQDIAGVEWYQLRARIRCYDNDYFVASRPRVPGYERYNQQSLCMGAPHFYQVPADVKALPVARLLYENRDAFDQFIPLLEGVEILYLDPYIGFEDIWKLGSCIVQRTNVDVRIIAPFPHTTYLANHKGYVKEISDAMNGPGAVPQTRVSAEIAVLAKYLKEFAAVSETVALKRSTCASGMGNALYEGKILSALPDREVENVVKKFCEEKEWNGTEDILVVEWHNYLIESPSTQCWIPPLGKGIPRIEAVYRQFLTAAEGIFEGSTLSNLPDAVKNDFAQKSFNICLVFQQLGYVGRCSFDSIVYESDGQLQVRIVECNGRWGGTSLPMEFVQRIFHDIYAIPYKAQDYTDHRLKNCTFQDLLAIFKDDVYDVQSGRGRVLLYNVGCMHEHGKFDIIATGKTQEDAVRYLAAEVPRKMDSFFAGREL